MAKERSHKIVLEYPIEWPGGSASEVLVTKPKVRDLRKIDEAVGKAEKDFDAGVIVTSILTGLPAEAIEDMDSDDFGKVSEAIAIFFPQATAPQTGAVSSPKRHTT